MKWWNEGREFLGYDENREPMYTLSNGESIMFSGGLISAVIFVIICYCVIVNGVRF